MNDVRDEALGTLLERAALGIESVPVDRLPDVLRRGSRRRTARFTAIGAGVAIFASVISWAGLAIRNEDETIPADVADWRPFASLEGNGWTVQVPPSWRVQQLPSCPNAPERIGVIVTNTDFEFRSPDGGSPECGERHVFAGFPREGVVFHFQPWGDFGLTFPQPNTPFPLSVDLLQSSGGITGGPSESGSVVWVDRKIVGIVRRYVGPDASSGDVAALDRMLASLQVQAATRWVTARASTRWLHVGITYPEAWKVTRFEGITVIDAPQPILRLTTPGVRKGFCLGGPWGEFRNLGRFGVVVAVSDATGSYATPDFEPRPSTLQLAGAHFDRIVRCGDAVRMLQFEFEEAGRPIVLNIAVSTLYLREHANELRHILNSIRIEEA